MKNDVYIFTKYIWLYIVLSIRHLLEHIVYPTEPACFLQDRPLP